ncbi:hypothetical protein DMUE_1891 [Dictyocoela muelleri]|nr:hypothetical protein DMUE_1891 [Dictyocoela muelleri]
MNKPVNFLTPHNFPFFSNLKNHEPIMKNKKSKRLTLKEKLDIIEYKKANKNVKNTRISEIFSIKFKKNINPRSIKNFLESEESIKNAYLINNKLISVPRIIKQVNVEYRI